MATKRDKTVSYRRAEWITAGSKLNLEKCINDALVKLTTVDERTIVFDGTHTRVAKHKTGTTGTFLHITSDTPGEYASVVPKVAANVSELDLVAEEPPTDGEWLDGDAFLYVNKDHVTFCTTGMRDGKITRFWSIFLKKRSYTQVPTNLP